MKTLNQLILLCIVVTFISCNNDDAPANNAPVLQDETLAIDENPAAQANLVTLTATDADQDALVFAIVSQTPTGATNLDATTGELSVADASLFDYEANTQITVNVSVTDGVDVDTATVTITLNDVVDLQPLIANQSFSIDEGALNTTQIGQVVASDPQNLSLAYVIVSESVSGAFSIGSSDGMLSVNEEFPFDYETNSTLTATVRVSNGTLDADATVTVNLNNLDYPKVGLRAGYLFDDNTNTIAADVTGNYNGDIINNVMLTTDRNNVADKAFQFNQGRVKIEEQALNGLSNFTITGWAKADTNVDGSIFNKGFDIELVGYFSNTTLALRYRDPVTNLNNPVEMVNGPAGGVWFHYAMVVENGNKWSLYIDGQLIETRQFTNANAWTTENINIGSYGNSSFWNGAIDDVLIYERVLSASEISALAGDSY